MVHHEREVWDRQVKEKSRWYSYFCVFLTLGPDRTNSMLHRHLASEEYLNTLPSNLRRPDFSNHSLQKQAQKYNWRARAEAWDAFERKRKKEEYELERIENREKRRRTLDTLLESWLDAHKNKLCKKEVALKDITNGISTIHDEMRTEYDDQPAQRVEITGGVTITMDDFAQAKHAAEQEDVIDVVEKDPQDIIDNLEPPPE